MLPTTYIVYLAPLYIITSILTTNIINDDDEFLLKSFHYTICVRMQDIVCKSWQNIEFYDETIFYVTVYHFMLHNTFSRDSFARCKYYTGGVRLNSSVVSDFT